MESLESTTPTTPAAETGLTPYRKSDSTGNPRLLEKYKTLVLDQLVLEELIEKREEELHEEKEKTTEKENEIQKLKNTASEQLHQIEEQDKLIDSLKTEIATLAKDFSEKLDTEKKARRLQTSLVRNDCFQKLEQKENILIKLRKGEEEMKSEISELDITIGKLRADICDLNGKLENVGELQKELKSCEESLQSERILFKHLQIKQENTVQECSRYKSSSKKYEEMVQGLESKLLENTEKARDTIELMAAKLLEYEESASKREEAIKCLEERLFENEGTAKKLQETVNYKDAQISNLNEILEEDYKYNMKKFEKLRKLIPSQNYALGELAKKSSEQVAVMPVDILPKIDNSPFEATSMETSCCGEETMDPHSTSPNPSDPVTKPSSSEQVGSSSVLEQGSSFLPASCERNNGGDDDTADNKVMMTDSCVDEKQSQQRIQGDSTSSSNSKISDRADPEEALSPKPSTSQGNIADTGEATSCTVCRKRFQNNGDLVKHITQVHKYTKSQGLYECRIRRECQLLFTSLKALRQHQRKDHNKYFLYISRTHETTKHTSFICKKCGKLFSKNLALDSHYKTFHSTGSQAGSSREQHIRTEQDDLGLQKDAILNQRPELPYEIQIHQPVPFDLTSDKASHRGHKCTCGRKYASKGSLGVHIKKMDKGKQYKCSWCSARFDALCNLRSHVIRVHKNIYSGEN